MSVSFRRVLLDADDALPTLPCVLKACGSAVRGQGRYGGGRFPSAYPAQRQHGVNAVTHRVVRLQRGRSPCQCTDGWGGREAQDSVSLQQAGYRARLYTPTMITRLLGTYFIVDCWHHRIIHSRNLHAPLVRWKTLDDDIAGPHSIATDGTFHVAEDTGRHGLFVYRETAPDHFERVQHCTRCWYTAPSHPVRCRTPAVSGGGFGGSVHQPAGGAGRQAGSDSDPDHS